MTLEEIKTDLKFTKEIKVNKKPNKLGYFTYQYHNGKKWQIGAFISYESAISFFYLECNFTEQKNYNNFVILEKEQ